MSDELAGKKILLVDDDHDILSSMALALGDLGAEIDMASDGNTAVQKAEQDSPDLVVLDMMLPKRSGFLVLERIKRDQAPGEKPFVFRRPLAP